MEVLSIGQLATITGGQLRLGDMPPLGGDCEPVRRFVHATEPAVSGDVVFHTATHIERSCWLENTFSDGALGIIADTPLTAWDGRFVLQVSDPNVAARRLAAWCRSRRTRHVTLIVTPADKRTSTVELNIQSELRRIASTVGPNTRQNGSQRPWLWPLVSSYPRPSAVLLAAQLDRIRRTEIAACRPELVVLAPEFATDDTPQPKHRSGNNCLESKVAITLRRDDGKARLDSYFPSDANTNAVTDDTLGGKDHVVDLTKFQGLQRLLAVLRDDAVIVAPKTLLPQLLTRGQNIHPYQDDNPSHAGLVCGQIVRRTLAQATTVAG